MKVPSLNADVDSGRRIKELDSIRGLAACAVLYTHLPRGFWFGETGVDLFFVLSGFLITTIILRNCEQPSFLKVFYFRRSLRIFPIYYLAIFAVLGLNALKRHPGAIDGIGYYFVYLQNIHSYWGGVGPAVDLPIGHTWTLAIEEQFYLLWPAIVLIVGASRLIWVSLTLIALPIILRNCGLDYATLFGHSDGLAFGALLAYFGFRSPRMFVPSRAPWYLAVALLGFVAYFALWSHVSATGATGTEMVRRQPISISIVSLAYAGVIAFAISASGSRWTGFLRLAPLVWIGTISYGLYLYHWIIYDWLDTIIKFGWRVGDPWWLDVLKVAASFAAAAVSWYVIERPMTRLKGALRYRRVSGLQAPQVEQSARDSVSHIPQAV